MIDARAVIKSVFLHTCIENWWGIKNQICNCSQWYLLWAYYAMKIKTFSRNKKNLRGDDSFHFVTCINSLMNRQRKKVLRKHWPEQFLKHEQSYGIFFFLLNSVFQQIYSDHLLWKQVWITVKTCYTINFIFIFFCNFPTLINFGRLRQHILSIVETSTKTFCSKNFSLVSHFAYFSDLLMPHG